MRTKRHLLYSTIANVGVKLDTYHFQEKGKTSNFENPIHLKDHSI